MSACGRLFVEEIFRWQRLIGAWRGLVPANDAAKLLRGGAVSFPERFGGSLVRVLRYLTREGLVTELASMSKERADEPSAIEACVQSSVGLGNLAALSGDKVKHPAVHPPSSVSRRARGGEFNIHASVTATPGATSANGADESP